MVLSNHFLCKDCISSNLIANHFINGWLSGPRYMYMYILYYIILYYIILYDIIWYYSIWYYIIWYYIIWYDMIWYDIIWYFILLYYIIFYFILLYYIIWYYMILFYIFWNSTKRTTRFDQFFHPNQFFISPVLGTPKKKPRTFQQTLANLQMTRSPQQNGWLAGGVSWWAFMSSQGGHFPDCNWLGVWAPTRWILRSFGLENLDGKSTHHN